MIFQKVCHLCWLFELEGKNYILFSQSPESSSAQPLKVIHKLMVNACMTKVFWIIWEQG